MEGSSIIWRRLDLPGHESCRLSAHDSRPRLNGTAVFTHEGQPCRLDYEVVCDAAWQTVSTRVAGWVGNESVEIELSVGSAHRWRLNGMEQTQVEGCVDVDLNFSPSTNLLPIRRLGLSVGRETVVRAAWLRFPSFALEPLKQVYRREGEAEYLYTSAGGQFVAKLRVNEVGFVTHYPNLWQVESSSSKALH